MTMETEVVKSDALRANLGLAAGFVVALAFIGGSAYCIVNGHDVAGTVLGGGTIASLVGTFVYGTNSRRHERKEREKMLVKPQDEPD